ncbi:MAG TPA: 50S ribosomal protein L11 methyltransferase [Anaerolineales bacterium]|nr:50S ribosomal protein L11 methyltransferase [Anaerolineales bacterium]
MTAWLEVTLSVDAETAEAVADLLAQHAPYGVVLETERLDPESLDSQVSPTTQVRAFLPKDDSLAGRLYLVALGLWHLGQIRPIPAPEFRDVSEENWAETWKANYRPITVGRRLQIVPAWLDTPPGDRLTLSLDPGMAFGTGSHPTTRLCLEALEDALQPGDVVADVGCGSGILSIAAARLGARRVYACDIDPVAVAAAQQGAAHNAVAEGIIVFQGSLEELRGMLTADGLEVDILLGNLLESILVDLLPRGLADTVRPGGTLVLSGILAEQEERVLQASERQGLRHLETLSEADWRALVLQRP